MKHARVAIAELKEGTVNATVRHVEQELLPLFRGQPGFISYALYHGPGNMLFSVSEWESREAAEEAVRLANTWTERAVPEAVFKQVVVGEQAFEAATPVLGEHEAAPGSVH
jgi:heme-degrading monooxygenase HmoA